MKQGAKHKTLGKEKNPAEWNLLERKREWNEIN